MSIFNDIETLQYYTEAEDARLIQEEAEIVNRVCVALEDALFGIAKMRAAQVAYMQDRGNNQLGKLVAEAAVELDNLLKRLGTHE
jgi:hypothetical protein